MHTYTYVYICIERERANQTEHDDSELAKDGRPPAHLAAGGEPGARDLKNVLIEAFGGDGIHVCIYIYIYIYINNNNI